MKKKITLIMFAILWVATFSLQAGVRIGVKAGVNLANASFSSDAVQTKNFTGFQVGPIVEFSTIAGLGVDAALLYNQIGFTAKGTDVGLPKSEVKTSTLDVPVNLKFKISIAGILGGYLTAGPYVSFKLDDKFSLNKVQQDWNSKTFGVGLNFGAGVVLIKNLQVGINYQLGLSDDYSLENNAASTAAAIISAKARVWSITATYFF